MPDPFPTLCNTLAEIDLFGTGRCRDSVAFGDVPAPAMAFTLPVDEVRRVIGTT